jgi:hypothetical protein
MTDEQKEDLQFWFYTKVFTENATPPAALTAAAAEVGIETAVALDYLKSDGRVSGGAEALTINRFDRDASEPSGIFVDIEWMLHILHRHGLRDQTLWSALGSIYKIPAELARQEAEQIVIEEGED